MSRAVSFTYLLFLDFGNELKYVKETLEGEDPAIKRNIFSSFKL